MLRHLRVRAVVLLALAAALTLTIGVAPARTERARAAAQAQGIGKLDHLIFIVQENRSFDHYFGTYPGADGIPMTPDGKPKPCIPDPVLGHCVRPYHSSNQLAEGGPHAQRHSIADVDGGRMDGFVRMAVDSPLYCPDHRDDPKCASYLGPQGQPDVMSYHTRKDIPNYWAYADHFVLQDRMFESVDSWTLPSHLFMVSGWSANCTDFNDPMSCTANPQMKGGTGDINKAVRGKTPYAWTDITYLLHEAGVSWGYYVAPGTCMKTPCPPQPTGTPRSMNPLIGFTDVSDNEQMGNIKTHPAFFTALKKGSLPSVSWVIPSFWESEHPPASIPPGVAFVTKTINAIMRSPEWKSSAIFLTWDDWGGFYDHVVPPKIDNAGYGLRVPGLLISPYAKRGFIDSQTLSYDAYLKLIEDLFIGGQRLDPATKNWFSLSG